MATNPQSFLQEGGTIVQLLLLLVIGLVIGYIRTYSVCPASLKSGNRDEEREQEEARLLLFLILICFCVIGERVIIFVRQ